MPGLDLPAAEYEIFAKPPLKAMLGQVRFPAILKIADLGILSAFQDAIREDWPEFSQEQQITLALGPGVPAAQAGTQQSFRFTSADKAWSAILSPDTLTLEAAAGGEYSSYEQFSKRFRQIWDALLDHFSPSAILRQGLRYVDHLEDEDRRPADWARLINAELMGPMAGRFAEGLEQAVSELRFRYDGAVFVFKHGIVPAGPEMKNGYLLDFDYFNDEQTSVVSTEALMESFDRYHEEVYALFRWAVTDEALEGFRDGG